MDIGTRKPLNYWGWVTGKHQDWQGEMLLVCSEFSWLTRVAITEIMKLSEEMNKHHREIMYDNKETGFVDKNDVSVVQKKCIVDRFIDAYCFTVKLYVVSSM